MSWIPDLAQAVSQQKHCEATARAKLELDKQPMDKQEQLLKQGFISQIAFDELVNNYEASTQNYKASIGNVNQEVKATGKYTLRHHLLGGFIKKVLNWAACT